MDAPRTVRTQWISGYEGRYKIRDDGTVLSYLTSGVRRRTEPVVRKLNRGRKGYLYVGLRLRGVPQKHFLVHRLVAKAFIRNPRGLPQINHHDFDRANNRYRNLKWVTAKQNTEHSKRAGRLKFPSSRLGEAHHAHKLTRKAAGRVKELLALGMSDLRISKLFSVWPGTIRNIRVGISWRWLR